MVWGHTKLPGGECHRYGKGVRKRDEEVWSIHNIWYFWHGCWWMCRWTVAVLLCMHSGFPALRLEQMIVTSLYDVTRISCATVGRELYKESTTKPRGCCYCHLGVSTQAFGSFNNPQTLYFGCLSAPWVGSITGMHSVICLSICMHPDLFGGLLSYCDFICLMATR